MVDLIIIVIVVVSCELGAGRPELAFTCPCATFIVARHQAITSDVKDDGTIDDLPGVDALLYLITCERKTK